MSKFTTRIQHAWNAFMNKDPTYLYKDMGPSYSTRPYVFKPTVGTERSIINAIFNRIAVDCSSMDVKHVRIDDDGNYESLISDSLNNCLTIEANIDQTGRAFILDAIMSLLDWGVIAVVPIDTTIDPERTDSYSIESMRVGKILEWYKENIRVEIYNQLSGRREEITIPKKIAAIIENPFYSTMNEKNSILQRLIRKMNLLDVVDEQSTSGKLDLIIQLPYVVKSEQKRLQAKQRLDDIKEQLTGNKFGIAYTDGTEKITQLNRAVENNLMTTIEYLTSMLYSQLGITQSIMDGSATPTELNNYYNRTIEPIMSAIVDEMNRKFLSKTARTQNQRIKFFRDPFKLVPAADLAELADKFTRNEILTSNEFRQILGKKPSNDPKADELRNSNIARPDDNGRENTTNIKEENQDEI